MSSDSSARSTENRSVICHDMFSGRSVRLAVKARSWNATQVEWTHAAQCVQLEEKDRIGRFIFKKDAKLAMMGRLLMRYAISKMLNVPYSTLRFGRTNKGKPFLQNPVNGSSTACYNLSFNISHQGDYVVFVAEKGSDVGVDVMKVEWPRSKPVQDFFNTMERQLTSDEWKEVCKRSGDMEQLKTFYRLWCLKESLVKAWGTGIGFEVGRLNFHFKTPEVSPEHTASDTTVEIDDEPAPEWEFQETMLEDHCVAVAVSKASENTVDAICKDTAAPPVHVLEVAEVLVGCEPLAGNVPDVEYWQRFSSREEQPGAR